MINFSAPLQGMTSAESGLNRVAQRIAANPAQAGDPGDAVETVEAVNQFDANVAAEKVGNELTQATLSLLA